MTAENEEFTKNLTDNVEQLLLPHGARLQNTDLQREQHTLHITYTPLLPKTTVEQIKSQFRRNTGFTLGMASAPQTIYSAGIGLGSSYDEAEEMRKLLNVAQRLFAPYHATLQHPKPQFQQRTLHISCTPVLPQPVVDQIKFQFRQQTGWTLGVTLIPQQNANTTNDTSLLARNEEHTRQQLLTTAEQLLLPYGSTLQSPKLQFQQRTLHISCSPVLPQSAVDQIKLQFRQQTGWTLGVASVLRQGTPSVEEMYIQTRHDEQAEQRHLLNLVQQLLARNDATLQDVRYQFQQRTLHISCSPVLAQPVVDQIKFQFRQQTGWTLGVASILRQGTPSTAHPATGEEQEEQRRFLNIAQQLLPYDSTLQSIKFQFQQRTLHISCTPLLTDTVIGQIKAQFQFITGWTLGITSFPEYGQTTAASLKAE